MGCKYCNNSVPIMDTMVDGTPEGFTMVISKSESGKRVLLIFYNDGIDVRFQIYDIEYCPNCGEKLNQEIQK